jgi:glutathione S-transferase
MMLYLPGLVVSFAISCHRGLIMTEAAYELVIGDKRLSSWSLRPWLLLKAFGIPFRETLIRLRQTDTADHIAGYSPSGKVPLLKAGELVVWDSLAIAEFVAEEHPDKAIWPADRMKRAVARAISAEMHSGFYSLRSAMPMDFLKVYASWPVEAAEEADIRRIVAIWRDCRARFGDGGDFLFGAFSAADAMYAPVVTRFRSYSVDLAALGDDGTAARYRDMMFGLKEMSEWGEGAALEN